MNQFRPLAALMRLGYALALGALVLGVIGALLAWMSAAASAALPLLMLAPGVALLVAAGAFAFFALRSEPDAWANTYRSCSRVAFGAAALAALAVLVLGLALGARAGSVPQTILVVLLALEGPLALWLVGRRLASLSRGA